jgi:hypothetical protein
MVSERRSWKRNVGVLTTVSLSLTGATFLLTQNVVAVTGVLTITFLLLSVALLRSR